MRLEIEFSKEMQDLIKSLSGFESKVKMQTNRALLSVANDIHRDIINSILRGVKTGATYYRARGNRVHKASAPGEAPANDYGNLHRNIKVFPELQQGYIDVGVKETDVDYAAALEFGTSQMAERPFLAPAVKKNMQNFEAKVKKALENSIREL